MTGARTASPRRVLSAFFVVACALCVVVALIPLAFVLFFVVSQGVQSLNLDFFINNPRPVGEAGGGMANAIVGTLMLTGLAAAMAVPIGVLSGVYLSEYRGSRFASAVRFAADTLNGVPSIVIGVFAYAVVVLPLRQQIVDETLKHYNAMDADPFALIVARKALVTGGHEYLLAVQRYAAALSEATALRRGALLAGEADHTSTGDRSPAPTDR